MKHEKLRQAWRPALKNGYLGFNVRGVERAFAEACVWFGVELDGPRNQGYSGRNLGGPVRRRDGSRFWVKVGGTYSADNWYVAGEAEAAAITSVPKPAAIERRQWRAGRTHWAATLMTLVPGAAVETTPWSGPRARSLSDRWIAAVREASVQLSSIPTRRVFHTPEFFAATLRTHYGVSTSLGSDQWRSAHGDFNWVNLMQPLLSIVDWEFFAAGPPGVDLAWLLAYSCADAELSARLESAFAPLHDSVRLFAAHSIKEAARGRWLDPEMVVPLEQVIARLVTKIRVT